MTRRLRRTAARLIQSGCRLAPALLLDRSGTPSIEFALIAPVMFGILAGSYDITQIFIAMRQVTSTAQEIVQIATEQAVQPDQSNALTVDQAKQATTAIYAMMPGLKSGADTSPYSVALSAIVFVTVPTVCGTASSCGVVAWSVALPLPGLQVKRSPCGVVTQVTPDQQPTTNNLPTSGMTTLTPTSGANTLTSVVVADVSYKYQPLFSGFVTGPVTLQRTAFLPPRAGKPSQYVQYDKANASSNPAVCKWVALLFGD